MPRNTKRPKSARKPENVEKTLKSTKSPKSARIPENSKRRKAKTVRKVQEIPKSRNAERPKKSNKCKKTRRVEKPSEAVIRRLHRLGRPFAAPCGEGNMVTERAERDRERERERDPEELREAVLKERQATRRRGEAKEQRRREIRALSARPAFHRRKTISHTWQRHRSLDACAGGSRGSCGCRS